MESTETSRESSVPAEESPPRASTKRRHLPRFGLRALFVVAVLFCLFFAWIGRNLYRIRQEEAAVETLKRAGAIVLTRVEWGPRDHPATASYAAGWGNRDGSPSWLERAFGADDPHPVDQVDLHGESGAPAQQDALEALAAFPELETVRIHGEAFTDDAIPPLARLPKLRDLTVARTRITGTGLAKLAPAPCLRRLTLGELADEAEIVSGVASLPQLRELHLYGVRVSRANVDSVSALPNLDSFHLGDVVLTGDDVFAPLREASALREFGLSLNATSRPMTDADARSIAQAPDLRTLRLSRYDTTLLAPFLETDSLQMLGLYGGPDDRAAGRDFSAKHPGCLVECVGTASPAAFYLGGREVERAAAEKRLLEPDAR